MAIWPFGRKKSEESRGAVNLGGDAGASGVQVFATTIDTFGAGVLDYSGSEHVTIDEALGVPAVWAAVNFIAATMASLPIHVYQESKGERKRSDPRIEKIIGQAPNPYQTSYDWRHMAMTSLLTYGRSLSWIERDGSEIVAIWPIPLSGVTFERVPGKSGRIRYVRNGVVYDSEEVIDLAFIRKPDGLGHYSPIDKCAGAIRQAINAQKYALTVFGSKGIPPFVIQGPYQTTKGAARAEHEIALAAARAMAEGRPAIALQPGHEIKQIQNDPERMQLVETQRFAVEQIARIYGIPPVFLQDLSRATFSNAEQQDLHFVKHALRRWVVAFEQELSLKLFRDVRGSRYVKINLDGLLRGDFKTRLEGLATAVQNGILTPNEARDLENRQPMPNGDDLMIQGATVPIGSQTAQIGGRNVE